MIQNILVLVPIADIDYGIKLFFLIVAMLDIRLGIMDGCLRKGTVFVV